MAVVSVSTCCHLVVALSVLLTRGLAEQPAMEFEVTEEAPAYTFVGDIGEYVLDLYDQSVLDQIQFDILSQPHQDTSYFDLEESQGILRTAKPIDRDVLCPTLDECTLDIDVAIVRPIQYFQVLPIRVSILDINDNYPVFPEEEIPVSLSESSNIGTTISLPNALDLDSPKNGVEGYKLLSDADVFDMRSVMNAQGQIDLQLVLVAGLDREAVDSYLLELEVYDGGAPTLSSTVAILVTVEDANDHSPVFQNTSQLVRVDENFPLDTSFFKALATDLDSGLNGQVSYRFAPRTQSLYGKQFGLLETTGAVYLKQELDWERKKEYQLDIVASDRGPDSRATQSSLQVLVQDVNDNSPQVTINTLTDNTEAKIPENSSPSTFVAHVSVFDSDQGKNGEVICDLNNREDFFLNSIQRNQYKIETSFELDREAIPMYQLQVLCQDLGDIPLSSQANLTVIVVDENDHSPTFTQSSYSAVLPENNAPDAYIMHLNATDPDFGDNGQIRYEIVESISEYAYINSNTGVVRASGSFDYEKTKKLVFTAKVKDRGNPPRSSTAHVTINILDLNDQAPRFSQTQYSFNVRENHLKYYPVGRVSATDKDSNNYNRFVFSILEIDNPGTFAIDPDSGEIKTLEVLDREDQDTYYLTALATDLDQPSLSSSAMVEIHVDDANDNFPVIDYPTRDNNSFSISNLVPRGHEILKVSATDADASLNAKLSYSISHGNFNDAFHINVTSGMLSTKTTFEGIKYEAHELTLMVNDHGYPSKAATMDILITVDENTPYYHHSSGEDTSMVKGTNLTIIIVVASVSGFIMVILIIAITAMKLYDKRRPTSIYKCRVEEEKILRKAAMAEAGRGSRDNSLRSTGSVAGVKKHGENGPADVQRGHDSRGGSGSNAASWEGTPAAPAAHDTYTLNTGPDQHLEAHLLALLKQDRGDTESASSAEVSNADSGRGPSEEGEQNYHPSSRHAYPSNYGVSHTFSNKSSLSPGAGIHPQRKAVSHHQKSLSEQDIHQKPTPSSAIIKKTPSGCSVPHPAAAQVAPPRGSFHCLVREEQERQGRQQPQNINKNHSPKKKLSTFASPPSYEACVSQDGSGKDCSKTSQGDNPGCHGNGNHGNNKTTSANAQAQYLPQHKHQTPDPLHNIAEEEDCDDMNGDSNHSDEVDPQELCHEIDNLFFKSVVV